MEIELTLFGKMMVALLALLGCTILGIFIAWILMMQLQIRRQQKIIEGLLDRLMAGDYRLYAQVEARKAENQQVGIYGGDGNEQEERGVPIY